MRNTLLLCLLVAFGHNNGERKQLVAAFQSALCHQPTRGLGLARIQPEQPNWNLGTNDKAHEVPYHRLQNMLASSTCLMSLTERQMQFWEDVEDGLDPIEQYYLNENGQNLHRIRQFVKSAKGEIPPPTPKAPGHDPSEENIEGLTTQPFWDAANQPDLFPWAAKLEEQAEVIIKEFKEKILGKVSNSDKTNGNPFAGDSVWQNQVMGEGWSAIRLQRLGVWNTENCEQFPATYQLLRSLAIPLAVRGVCFARQAPGSGVQPHSDGRNFILTSHLGLQVPDGCWIQVGEGPENRRGWNEGKLTTIDTSFQHSTGNPSTTTDRHVLIIDYWHPELTQAERAGLEFIYDLRNQFESGAIPVRRPRSLPKEEGGLRGWWKSVTSGGE